MTCRPGRRGRGPQTGTVAGGEVLRARVLAALGQSRTPLRIAGRLRLEAGYDTVGLMKASPPAAGKTVSHEAIYRFICALPKGEFARHGVLPQSRRTRRRRPSGPRALERGPDHRSARQVRRREP